MTILDTMAQRYHLLPTDVMARATTFDLEVMFLSQDFQHRRQADLIDVPPGGKRTVPRLNQQQMQDMLARARSRTPK